MLPMQAIHPPWLCSSAPLLRRAQIFMFCINEKGDSWAYATPGFGEALVPDHLRSLRVMGTRTMEAAQARPTPDPCSPGSRSSWRNSPVGS